jgi:predicted nucleic acid-binding protein
VKSLRKVIFRSRNDGDSVKISLPIENIIDIEESPVIELAETFKIRVYDNDETFAMDEVCSPRTMQEQEEDLANLVNSTFSPSSASARMLSMYYGY